MGSRSGKTNSIPGFSKANLVFLEELVKTGNRTEAIMKAYPDSNRDTAITRASLIIARDGVKEYLQALILSSGIENDLVDTLKDQLNAVKLHGYGDTAEVVADNQSRLKAASIILEALGVTGKAAQKPMKPVDPKEIVIDVPFEEMSVEELKKLAESSRTLDK